MTRRRSGVWAVRILLVVVLGTVASMAFRDHRDGDGWAAAVAVAAALVLAAGLTWLLTGLWARRAARVRREHPGAWVRPMSRGRALGLLYLDGEKVELLGLFGRTPRTHPRADLVAADVGPIRFPAATRTGLRLRFRDGDEWDLLSMRRGGLASSEADARSACDYLGHDATAVTPTGPVVDRRAGAHSGE